MKRLESTAVKELLRKASLLNSVPDEDLEMLGHVARHRSVGASEVIFSRGELSGSVYWLATGRVRITSLSRGGSELLLGMVEEGETFGELALLPGSRRIVSAISEQPSYLISLSDTHLVPVVERNPGAALAFSRLLAHHLHNAVSDLASIGLLEARERLYLKIMSLGRRYGRPNGESDGLHIDHGLSQEDLARSIGLTRVIVNRQLAEWRTAGLTEHGRGFIDIRSQDDLEAYVQGDVSRIERESG